MFSVLLEEDCVDLLPSFPESMNPLAITLWRPRLWSLSIRLKLKIFLLCCFSPLRLPSVSLSFKAAKVLVEGLRIGGRLGLVEAEIPRSWSRWIRPKLGVMFVAGLWKKPCWWSGKVLTCSLLPEVDRLWGWKLYKHMAHIKWQQNITAK